MCIRYSNDLSRLHPALEEWFPGEFNKKSIRQRFHNLSGPVSSDGMGVVLIGQRNGALLLESMRWGLSPPSYAHKGPVTSLRNLERPCWRSWLDTEWRCLIPATAFAIPEPRPGPGLQRREHWFTRTGGKAFFFAGIWRNSEGGSAATGQGAAGRRAFSLVTTSPNGAVAEVNKSSMPVILTAEGADAWLFAPAEVALTLQRPAESDEVVVLPEAA